MFVYCSVLLHKLEQVCLHKYDRVVCFHYIDHNSRQFTCDQSLPRQPRVKKFNQTYWWYRLMRLIDNGVYIIILWHRQRDLSCGRFRLTSRIRDKYLFNLLVTDLEEVRFQHVWCAIIFIHPLPRVYVKVNIRTSWLSLLNDTMADYYTGVQTTWTVLYYWFGYKGK